MGLFPKPQSNGVISKASVKWGYYFQSLGPGSTKKILQTGNMATLSNDKINMS
jgi:hypothetical protein